MKFTIEVEALSEDHPDVPVVRVSIDGQPVGTIQTITFEADKDSYIPRAKVHKVVYSKEGLQDLQRLRRFHWIQVFPQFFSKVGDTWQEVPEEEFVPVSLGESELELSPPVYLKEPSEGDRVTPISSLPPPPAAMAMHVALDLCQREKRHGVVVDANGYCTNCHYLSFED